MTIDTDSVRFSRALRSAILWPVGLIFLTALLLLLLVFQLFQVIRISDHSDHVIEQASLCEKQILALQNDVRGYLLTGKSDFIHTYDDQCTAINGSLQQLKLLVQDNPPQVIRAEDMIETKTIWFEHSRNTVLQRTQGTAPDPAWTSSGEDLMEGLIAKLDRFNATEEDLRRKRLQHVQQMKAVLLYAGGGLSVLLSLTVGQLVRRDFMKLAGEHRSALDTIEQRHKALARSEADLVEQKEWFRVTLRSIGDGVIVTDEEGRIVFMNDEAERLTDWKGMDAMLKPVPQVFKIINEQTRKPVEDPVAKVFREKRVVGLSHPTVLISCLGQEWPIEDSAAPIYDVRGSLLGVVLVFHNATEMRRAQNSLKAYSVDLEKKVAERTLSLQQTVADLEAFSYTISHDLRSPLRAMQGFAEAVSEDYSAKLDDRGQNYLNRIKNAAERLDRLIQDLLAYTRLSREEAQLVPLDLDRSVRDIIEHYPNFHPPAAEITVVGTLPRIMGREAALTQVISNLLGNAVKFVPEGTVPQIKIWGEDVGGRFRLWVEDNGIGIAARDFERIFQMFIQVNEPALYGGTGVGLAIVKKAVQTMQGSVGVNSETGKGSKFWVEFNQASS